MAVVPAAATVLQRARDIVGSLARHADTFPDASRLSSEWEACGVSRRLLDVGPVEAVDAPAAIFSAAVAVMADPVQLIPSVLAVLSLFVRQTVISTCPNTCPAGQSTELCALRHVQKVVFAVLLACVEPTAFVKVSGAAAVPGLHEAVFWASATVLATLPLPSSFIATHGSAAEQPLDSSAAEDAKKEHAYLWRKLAETASHYCSNTNIDARSSPPSGRTARLAPDQSAACIRPLLFASIDLLQQALNHHSCAVMPPACAVLQSAFMSFAYGNNQQDSEQLAVMLLNLRKTLDTVCQHGDQAHNQRLVFRWQPVVEAVISVIRLPHRVTLLHTPEWGSASIASLAAAAEARLPVLRDSGKGDDRLSYFSQTPKDFMHYMRASRDVGSALLLVGSVTCQEWEAHLGGWEKSVPLITYLAVVLEGGVKPLATAVPGDSFQLLMDITHAVCMSAHVDPADAKTSASPGTWPGNDLGDVLLRVVTCLLRHLTNPRLSEADRDRVADVLLPLLQTSGRGCPPQRLLDRLVTSAKPLTADSFDAPDVHSAAPLYAAQMQALDHAACRWSTNKSRRVAAMIMQALVQCLRKEDLPGFDLHKWLAPTAGVDLRMRTIWILVAYEARFGSPWPPHRTQGTPLPVIKAAASQLARLCEDACTEQVIEVFPWAMEYAIRALEVINQLAAKDPDGVYTQLHGMEKMLTAFIPKPIQPNLNGNLVLRWQTELAALWHAMANVPMRLRTLRAAEEHAARVRAADAAFAELMAEEEAAKEKQTAAAAAKRKKKQKQRDKAKGKEQAAEDDAPEPSWSAAEAVTDATGAVGSTDGTPSKASSDKLLDSTTLPSIAFVTEQPQPTSGDVSAGPASVSQQPLGGTASPSPASPARRPQPSEATTLSSSPASGSKRPQPSQATAASSSSAFGSKRPQPTQGLASSPMQPPARAAVAPGARALTPIAPAGLQASAQAAATATPSGAQAGGQQASAASQNGQASTRPAAQPAVLPGRGVASLLTQRQSAAPPAHGGFAPGKPAIASGEASSSRSPQQTMQPPPQAALQQDDDDEYFICPITQERMVDPVFCMDGITYERSAITQWLQMHDTSHMTNEVMPSKVLVPNVTMRGQLRARFPL